MKSLFLKTLAAGLIASPAAYALSLYDMAPPIGIPESHAVRYSAHISAGYDDNVNSAKANKQDGSYVRFGLGATYADYESALKINYHANIGGQLYNKTANGTDQRLFSDISGGMQMSRSLGAGRVISLSLYASYRPEPDYANGISAARTQGDCINWSASSAYSQAIDSRWSWTLSASTSGNVYNKGAYKIDDREYVTTSASLNYKSTTRTSYSLATTYRFDFREHGFNSKNLYLNFGVNHAIDPVSSCALHIGLQSKNIGGKNNLYPNLRASYNRKLGSGLSVRSYLSLDNENINTYGRYKGKGYNYLSDLTWRVGVDCTYAITPLLDLTFGSSILSSNYSKGTEGVANWNHTTWSANCGLSYKFRPNTSLHITYQYTHSTGSYNYGYDRNNLSAGISYSF